MMRAPVFDDVVVSQPSVDPGFGYVAVAGGALPLEEIWLRADIAGLACLVELRATFYNSAPSPLEATYVFPLPELAAVSSLQIRTGTTVIDGWLMERAEARDRYAASRLHRDKAVILEQEREDLVTIRVGTLAPGERVTVRLLLSMRLSYCDGEFFFRFPLVAAPRYIPGAPLAGGQVGAGTSADTHLVPDASRVSPPIQPGSSARLSVLVSIAPGAYRVDEVGCTLRTRILSTEADRMMRIEALPGQPLDRDLVLRIRAAAHALPSLSLLTSVDGGGSEGTFALTVLPPALDQMPSGARDVVVVVDASAVMSGWRRSAARRAAAHLVNCLGPSDRFSVLVFADAVSNPGWAGLVPATERNRFRAIEHVIAGKALGNPDLHTASGLLDDPGRPSFLVVITGGQVGNEDQITSSFTLKNGVVRVHTIGIGGAVNTGLLRRLAGAGRGEMLIAETEDSLDTVLPTLPRLLGPAFLTNLSLAGEGLQLLTNTVSPSRPPDVYPGIATVITGRFRGSAAGSVAVSGTGIEGQPWASRVAAAPVEGGAVTQGWARAFLADLQHRYLRCRIEDAAGLEQLIVSTSLRFGVLTRFTAFVAVSNAPARAANAPREVIQSVELPADWADAGPDLSPYAIEYARIVASTRDPASGPAVPRPHVASRAAPPTAPGTPAPPPMPASPPPMAAPPMAAPPMAPPPMAAPPMAAPPMSAPPPPPAAPRSGSRAGRYIGAGVGAAVIAAGVSVVGVVATQTTTSTAPAPNHSVTATPTPPPTTTASGVDPGSGARLDVTISPQGSGCLIGAHVAGIPAGRTVRLVVVGKDGTPHQIAEWITDGSDTNRTAATSLRINEIGSVAVQDPSGRSYVTVAIR